jgi:hypothetical protein
MFASVAYSWTFYLLLALILATHQLVHVRLARALALAAAGVSAGPVLSEPVSPDNAKDTTWTPQLA